MGDDRADFDNVAWDRNDEAWEESQKWFRRVSTLRKIEAFVTQKLGKTAAWVTPMRIGDSTTSTGCESRGLTTLSFDCPSPTKPSFQARRLFERLQQRALLRITPRFQLPKYSSTDCRVQSPKLGPSSSSNMSKTAELCLTH